MSPITVEVSLRIKPGDLSAYDAYGIGFNIVQPSWQSVRIGVVGSHQTDGVVATFDVIPSGEQWDGELRGYPAGPNDKFGPIVIRETETGLWYQAEHPVITLGPFPINQVQTVELDSWKFTQYAF